MRTSLHIHRDLDRDATLAEGVGVDVLFAPSVEEMYPSPPLTQVAVPALAESLCATSRPWHFGGVATVVAKLFGIIGPCRAYFGKKDAQQLAIVERLALDLNFPVTVVGCPIVRHGDGVAMSSRNVYLSAQDLRAARSLSRSLHAASSLLESGERDWSVLRRCLAAGLAEEAGVIVDYAEVMDRSTLLPPAEPPSPGTEWLLAVAARVGPARLIDNMTVMWSEDGPIVDRGIRVDDAASGQTGNPRRSQTVDPEWSTTPGEQR